MFMGENENARDDNTNDDNDVAQTDSIVEDTDADTRDVIENDNSDYRELSRRLDRMEEQIGRVLGGLDALRDAQSIIVDNGGTIVENDDDSDTGIDDFISPGELNLLV